MSPPEAPRGRLEGAVERRRTQRDRGEREGEPSLARNLAMNGALGWLIVLPTLGGIALGRWIDRRLGSGLTATSALLVLSLALGCGFAWKRLQRP